MSRDFGPRSAGLAPADTSKSTASGRVSDWLTNLVLVATLIAAGGTVVRALRSSVPDATPLKSERVADWMAVRDSGHFIGDPRSAVVITEFTDYECPSCAQYSAVLSNLVARHPGRVALSVRHFPLTTIHHKAMAASVASECAAAAGRFEAFHETAFIRQGEIINEPWTSFAAEAGITDMKAFSNCLSSPAARERVSRDMRVGRRLGIRGTPALMVNGELFSLGIAPDQLTEHVERLLSTGPVL